MTSKKNKVISLFEQGKTTQNEGVKYSGLIDEFVAPFEKEFPQDWLLEDVFGFAVNAWNFGNISMMVPEEEFDQIISLAPGEEEIDIELLKKMIAYKASDFKAYDRFITDFELIEVNEEPTLTVLTEDKESYLINMIDHIPEPTAEDFEDNYIDRYAIVLKPQQPFIDWFNALHIDEELTEIEEANIYLIDDSIHDPEKWLKKKFDKLFMLELDEWHPNSKKWPQKRTYKMFRQWFHVDISTMIYDLEKRPVIK